jgi:Kelch motif
MSYGDVESTQVTASGQLAPWQIAPSNLLTARFIASAFAFGNYLYIVGGHDGVRRLNSVKMAHINANGEVSHWSAQTELNHKRSATAAAINGQTVYLAGGIDDRGVLQSVEMVQFGPHGQLGHIRKTALADK